jgi:hypothetical protein
MSDNYALLRFSKKLLEEQKTSYILACREMFFESVYKPDLGVVLVIVENQADEEGEACRFAPDCKETMQLFFNELLSQYKLKEQDVPSSKTPI